MTLIYHITHVSNLASIAMRGLVCDMTIAEGAVEAHSIAFTDIKRRRSVTTVRCPPGGVLSDYVPFYFAPRSPMLYTIHQGNVPTVSDGQREVVHLVLSAEAVATSRTCVFTDGHAIMNLSNYYDDLEDLARLDWRAIQTREWGLKFDPTGETKRKKQAEFLVHGQVPWNQVMGIGVFTADCSVLAEAALVGLPHVPRVAVRRDWYY